MGNKQIVAVFHHRNNALKKIAAIHKYGCNIRLEAFPIETPLSPIVDDTSAFLPTRFSADLVLDFLTHPDLCHDLAARCLDRGIPIVASGKKPSIKGVLAPVT